MKKKIVGIFISLFLITTSLSVTSLETDNDTVQNVPRMINDALLTDVLDRIKTQHYSPDPGYYDTSEYMMGSVAVGVILPESIGGVSSEDWTTTEETNVQNEIMAALTWWKGQDANAGITFSYDWNFAVSTTSEPITGPSVFSNPSWEATWVSDVMNSMGYSSGDAFARVWSYINTLRTNKGTDWAFAVFVVDSSNDLDGCFSDATPPTYLPCAWAYLGGPWIVMTYDNGKVGSGGWGINQMNQVMAHETGHIFYATDEYNGNLDLSGYLNAADSEWSGCIMHNNNLCLSSGTRLQVGWRDTDVDNIHDILDTNPDTTLNPYSPDPTSQTTLTYTGSATVQPYTNSNPNGPGNDVTINTIQMVEYRVDGGSWNNANAVDGTYDGPTESFTMTIGPLAPGAHTIDARAKNSVNNYDTTPSSDTVTITTNNPPNTPSNPNPSNGATGVDINADLSWIGGDPDAGDTVTYDVYFGTTASPPLVSNDQSSTSYDPGTMTPGLKYYWKIVAEDNNGASTAGPVWDFTTVSGTNNPPTVSITSPTQGSTVSGTIPIQGSAGDSDGTVTQVRVKIDSGGTWWTASGTTIWSTNFDTNIVSDGAHTIYAQSKDDQGAYSTMDSVTVTVNNGGANNPPNKPNKPTGTTSGKAGNSYPYSTSATDPDGDKIKFGWDKNGDGTADQWDDNGGSYYNSGSSISTSLSWSSQGTYSLKVIAEDINGAQSPWSDPLSVSMPRNKPDINTPLLRFLQNFLENHPIMYQLFQRVLRL